MRNRLLATYSRLLVELVPEGRSPTWGVDVNGAGLNLPGVALMVVRDMTRYQVSKRTAWNGFFSPYLGTDDLAELVNCSSDWCKAR